MDQAHYVNKSRMGLGIAENGVCACRYHHHLLDNGGRGLRDEMLSMMEEHLKAIYPHWNKKDLVYRKWSNYEIK